MNMRKTPRNHSGKRRNPREPAKKTWLNGICFLSAWTEEAKQDLKVSWAGRHRNRTPKLLTVPKTGRKATLKISKEKDQFSDKRVRHGPEEN